MKPADATERIRIANDSLANLGTSASIRRMHSGVEEYAIFAGTLYTYRPLSVNEDADERD